MPKEQARRIRAALDRLAVVYVEPVVQPGEPEATESEHSVLAVKKLRGRDDYRLRVGKWRVIFDRLEDRIAVKTVRTRGDVYKR
jgi:mRNA-degrading endonuclease RelE of RelBE toxin-antitoxin system